MHHHLGVPAVEVGVETVVLALVPLSLAPPSVEMEAWVTPSPTSGENGTGRWGPVGAMGLQRLLTVGLGDCTRGFRRARAVSLPLVI